MHPLNTIAQADAFDYLAALPDGSVDAIVTDPPYLTTALAFDQQDIDWARLIGECLRVVKPSGAVVMFAAMRTAVAMISAAPKYYRYDWVWAKTGVTGFLDAKRKPLRQHEHVLVWSVGAARYFPVMGKGEAYVVKRARGSAGHYNGNMRFGNSYNAERYPTSVLSVPTAQDDKHPTQKPLDLMAYLVRTYTRAGEVVLDPFLGSGTTAVAARNLGRRYLGCDLSAEYLDIARRRLAEPFTPPLFADEPDAGDGGAVQLGLFGDHPDGG
jgi:site-specific DNA-methyltransferase (adenine-specific)